jgi:hypothetical protein
MFGKNNCALLIVTRGHCSSMPLQAWQSPDQFHRDEWSMVATAEAYYQPLEQ